MKTKIELVMLCLTVLLLMSCPIHAAAQPSLPMPDVNYFQGTITIGDTPAPDGLKVSAVIDGVECDYAIVANGKYGYGLSQNPEVILRVEGESGDIVSFLVEGIESLETADWRVGWTTLDVKVPSFMNSYTITSVSYDQTAEEDFGVMVRGCDPCGNVVTTDSETEVILASSSSTMVFDTDGDGNFGDTHGMLYNGGFDFVAKDTTPASEVTITAMDSSGRMGRSPLFAIHVGEVIVATDEGEGKWWNWWWVVPLVGACVLATALVIWRYGRKLHSH
ncbi:MAG: hypothetical protein SVY53_08170 [Chloroflexota bacterium]|nr:hypothetical protein [Chloroflexota bacterium]